MIKRFALQVYMLIFIFFNALSLIAQETEYPIKAIIFDLDGTIVDSEQYWFSMILKTLEAHSGILDRKEKDALHAVMHGNTMSNVMKWLKKTYALHPSIETLLQEYRTNCRTYYEGKIAFVSGFEAFFFNVVKRFPLRYAIASNSGIVSTEVICKSVNLIELFGPHIYHRYYVKQGKPAPDVYLYAAKQLNVQPYECIAIEDSAIGIRSAKNAGIFCIGLNRGDRSKVAQADLVVDSYDQIDLKKLIQGVNPIVCSACT